MLLEDIQDAGTFLEDCGAVILTCERSQGRFGRLIGC